jgi:hypothetical protein
MLEQEPNDIFDDIANRTTGHPNPPPRWERKGADIMMDY